MAELAEGLPWQPARPGVALPRTRSAPRLVVPDALLTDALAVLAGAASRTDAAAGCLPLLRQRPGVRAAAVLVRGGRSAVVVASAGYDCTTMAPGTQLPLEAGLPATEAVRTGRTVVRGTGPAWVAVPFGRGAQQPGALLLSLAGAPPQGPADLGRLHRLARAIGNALHRCAETERATAELAAVTDALRREDVAGSDVAVRTRCAAGEVGGDVVERLDDGRGGRWLVVADVMGSGLQAALVARGVRAAARACAGFAPGPAALLSGLEQGVAADLPLGSFVTALVVHLPAEGEARAATAGHPVPVVVGAAGPRLPRVEPGPPLGVAGTREEHVLDVAPGDLLVLHTDGLTERRGEDGVRQIDPVLLAAQIGGPGTDLGVAVDTLLAAADDAGRAFDDVAVLVARR